VDTEETTRELEGLSEVDRATLKAVYGPPPYTSSKEDLLEMALVLRDTWFNELAHDWDAPFQDPVEVARWKEHIQKGFVGVWKINGLGQEEGKCMLAAVTQKARDNA
jgi:hypothetical protein